MPVKLLSPVPGKLVLVMSFLVLWGCNSAQRVFRSTDSAVTIEDRQDWSRNSCLDLEQKFNNSVLAHGVSSALAWPVAENPLLKLDRFLLELAAHVKDSSQSEAEQWSSLAANLAIDVRAAENANLDSPWPAQAMARLADCSIAVSKNPQLTQIVASISSSDLALSNYSLGPKVLGFYALLRPIFRSRIQLLHREERALYEAETDFEQSSLYVLEESQAAIDIPDFQLAGPGNPLRLPKLDDDELANLFRLHAPVLDIEQQRDNDSIGAVTWLDSKMSIDLDRPTAYVYPSHTLFEGEVLLQLNYQFWFPERGPRSVINLYSGFLDGLIWRVTLDRNGDVLLYDSIHSCGCYHKYFMVNEKLLEREPPGSAEPAIVFDVPSLGSARPKLLISSNEHYIVGLKPFGGESANSAAHTRGFKLVDYAELSTLEFDENRRRSMFDSRGIVRGSERLERFTLWPTGIPSVGAMRQRGNHATGFVEEQHFDDATLLEQYFYRRGSGSRR